jgi:hypothetical protein
LSEIREVVGENMNRKLKGAVDVAMSVALLFLMGY